MLEYQIDARLLSKNKISQLVGILTVCFDAKKSLNFAVAF